VHCVLIITVLIGPARPEMSTFTLRLSPTGGYDEGRDKIARKIADIERRNEAEVWREYDAMVIERDSWRTRCEALTREADELKRKAAITTANPTLTVPATIPPHVDTTSVAESENVRLRNDLLPISERLETSSHNERTLTERLQTAEIALQVEETNHQRTIEDSRIVVQALNVVTRRNDDVSRERDLLRTQLNQTEAQRMEDLERLREAEQAREETAFSVKQLTLEKTMLVVQMEESQARVDELSKGLSDSQARETRLVEARNADFAEMAKLKKDAGENQIRSAMTIETMQAELKKLQQKLDKETSRPLSDRSYMSQLARQVERGTSGTRTGESTADGDQGLFHPYRRP
jgi:hypothetical protein